MSARRWAALLAFGVSVSTVSGCHNEPLPPSVCLGVKDTAAGAVVITSPYTPMGTPCDSVVVQGGIRR